MDRVKRDLVDTIGNISFLKVTNNRLFRVLLTRKPVAMLISQQKSREGRPTSLLSPHFVFVRRYFQYRPGLNRVGRHLSRCKAYP
jgi:hypothetical protein